MHHISELNRGLSEIQAKAIPLIAMKQLNRGQVYSIASVTYRLISSLGAIGKRVYNICNGTPESFINI